MHNAAHLRIDIDLRLETIPDAFFDSVSISQDDLLNSIERLIGQLDTKDGRILANQRNLQVLQRLDAVINATLFTADATYLTGLTTFGSEMIVQGGLVQSWFKVINPAFNAEALYNAKLAQTTGIAIDKLTASAVDQVFNKPLKDIINQSITTGATTSEINQSIREFIIGNDQIEGKLLRYSKQIGRDAFSVVDREITNFIANDLEMVWYLYAGNVIKDSRDFCVARAGKFFHRNEIEGWASLTWQGKAPVNEGTIFTLLGGYNCLHVVLPVLINAVPQDVIDRNINNGNYDPN